MYESVNPKVECDDIVTWNEGTKAQYRLVIRGTDGKYYALDPLTCMSMSGHDSLADYKIIIYDH